MTVREEDKVEVIVLYYKDDTYSLASGPPETHTFWNTQLADDFLATLIRLNVPHQFIWRSDNV